jgi:hypothetical protein
MAAAISSRSGVSSVIFSGGGIEATAQQHMSMHHFKLTDVAPYSSVGLLVLVLDWLSPELFVRVSGVGLLWHQ